MTDKKDLKLIAREIQAVISDVDGVFTNNQVLEGAPYKAKFRSYYDGQGVLLLCASGIRVCLITNEKGKRAQSIIDMVKKWNDLLVDKKIKHKIDLYLGAGGEGKVQIAEEWLKKAGTSFSQTAYMGDDLLDIPLLKKVVLSGAPAQAERVVKKMVDFVSERDGGAGGFRDFANFILEVKNIDLFKLSIW